MNTFEGQSTWSEKQPFSLHQTISDAINVVTLLSFVAVNFSPSQALAYVEIVEQPHGPLTFAVTDDLSLATSGIVHVKPGSSASDVLNSPEAQLPGYSPVFSPDDVVRVVATAYSSTAGQTDASPFQTANGTNVHPGTLAANFLPFGTKVEIGGTTYIVEDRLNSRYDKTYIVDIWKVSQEQAFAFGVRLVDMKIVELP
jgi:3D (Asp-Asp-Asp) domain-containing protein